MVRAFKIFMWVALAVCLLLAVSGAAYWQHLKGTPAYSLALMVEAAQRGDDAAVVRFVDIDQVVEGFVPQVAEELWGRGAPAPVVDGISELVEPLLPAIKKKARAEVPIYIREKTVKYKGYPVPLLVLGIGRLSTVKAEGDEATVAVKLPDRSFELVMRRDGGLWKVVGVRDEDMARKVAETIGQQVVLAASRGGLSRLAERLGLDGIEDALERLGDVVK